MATPVSPGGGGGDTVTSSIGLEIQIQGVIQKHLHEAFNDISANAIKELEKINLAAKEVMDPLTNDNLSKEFNKQLGKIDTKGFVEDFSKQFKVTTADIEQGISEALDPKVQDPFFDAQIRTLAGHRQRLELLAAEIKMNQRLKESYTDQLSEVTKIEAEIYATRKDADILSRLVNIGNKHLFDSLKLIDSIHDSVEKTVPPAQQLAGHFNNVGLTRIGGFLAGLGSGIALMGLLTHLTASYLEQQANWVQQNYALYGSIGQVNDQIIKASREGFLLSKEAEQAGQALMEMSIAKDSIVGLTATLGDVNKEIGLNIQVGARYAKQMQMLGLSTSDISKEFRFLKRSAAEWGVTGMDADKIFNIISESAYTMHKRLGDAGFREYQENLMKLGGIAKKSGVDMDSMAQIMKDLGQDRTKFILLMGKSDWLNEKDNTKLFQAMAGNAKAALANLATFPPAIQEEVSQSMYGMSQETLQQLDKMADAGGKSLSSIVPKDLSNEMRRATDPIYSFEMALKDIGQAVQWLLTPIIILITWLGRAAGWFTLLPTPIKNVVGAIIILTMAWLALGGALSSVWGWMAGAVKGLFTFGAAATTAATETAAATTVTEGAFASFGATMTPLIPVMLAVGATFALIAAAVWLLSDSITGLDKFIGALSGLGIAITGFAAVAFLAGALLSTAMVPIIPVMLAVAGVLLLLAGSVWVVSLAFDNFTKALDNLAQINLIKLGLEMVGGSSLILVGMTTLLAAMVVGAVMMPFALLTAAGLFALGGALALLGFAIKSGDMSRFPAFAGDMTVGMVLLSGALIIGAAMMPLILDASISFLALGVSLWLFSKAVTTDISGAPRFAASLSIAMVALIPALGVAAVMMPLIVSASVAFILLGASLFLFNQAINTDISGAPIFGLALSGAMIALIPALLIAATFGPLSILASVAFILLGASLLLFNQAISTDISGAPKYGLSLSIAMVALIPALLIAATFGPLSLLAAASFVLLGVSLLLFNRAINTDISNALKFGLSLSAGMTALLPALLIATVMAPLAIMAAATFVLLGLTIGIFADTIDKDIGHAVKFSLSLSSAMGILSVALMLAVAMLPLALAAGLTFFIIGKTINVLTDAINRPLDNAIKFGLRLTVALAALVPALLLADILLPLALLASATFFVVGKTIGVFADAINRDISQAPQFANNLSMALVALMTPLGIAALMMPYAIAAGITFFVLGHSIGAFADVINRNISDAVGFSIALSMALIALAPTLVFAAAMMPLAVAAGITFLALGVSIGRFADAINKDISAAPIFGIMLTAAIGSLIPALIIAGSLMPLAVFAGITFLALGLTIGRFADAINKDIRLAPIFSIMLLVAMAGLVPALTIAGQMLPLAVLASATFLVIGLTMPKFLRIINTDLKHGESFGKHFMMAMVGIRHGMDLIIGSHYIVFSVASRMVGAGLYNILSAINNNAAAVEVLPTLVITFQKAMEQLRYGMEWLIGSPYKKFTDAGMETGKGLGALLESINSGGVSNLPGLSANFQVAMKELRYGMEWLVGAPHKEFGKAADNVAPGLTALLNAVGTGTGNLPQAALLTSIASAVTAIVKLSAESDPASLPKFASSISDGLSILITSIKAGEDVIGRLPALTENLQAVTAIVKLSSESDPAALPKFANGISDGLSVLFTSIKAGQDVIGRLPALTENLQALTNLSSNATGGKAMIDMATSIDTVIKSLGDGLADYAAHVEASATRIGAALDIVKGKSASFDGSSFNHIVKNDAVNIVHPEMDSENSGAVHHKEMMDRMDKMVMAMVDLRKAVDDSGDDDSSRIAGLLNEYLPMIAENTESSNSGLGTRSNNWGNGG